MKKIILFCLLLFITHHSIAIWSPLGNGLPARVRALCVHNGELYAGGDFTECIKKWDGNSWVSVGGGLSGTAYPRVDALFSFNGELYAGGSFTAAGSASGNIVKLVGNSWMAVGDGLGGIAGSEVKCLVEFQGKLYAGGTFNLSGTSYVSKVAMLNAAGTSWLQAGGGAPPSCSAGVYTMTVYFNELYVGGQGSAPWINILNASGTGWLNMPAGGLQSGIGVYALCPFKYPTANNLSLFIGGDFTSPPSPSCCIYYSGFWATSVNMFSSGVTDQVNAFLSTSDHLYAGGTFTVAGATNIAKKGITVPWDTVGVTLNDGVNAFAIYNGFLVVGGQFTTANGTTVNHVTINDGVFVSDKSPEKPIANCTLFPNPASNQVSFLSEGKNCGKRSIEVYDFLGKEVFMEDFSSARLTIDVSCLPRGIYFYVLREDGIEAKKDRFIID